MVTKVFMFLTQDSLLFQVTKLSHMCSTRGHIHIFPIVLKMDYSLFIIKYVVTTILHTFSLT